MIGIGMQKFSNAVYRMILLMMIILILLAVTPFTQAQAKSQKNPVFNEAQMKPIGLDIDSFIYSEASGYAILRFVFLPRSQGSLICFAI